MMESSPTAKSTAGGPGDLLRGIEEALVAVRRATKDLAFYPVGHPALGRSLEHCHTQVRALADHEAPLVLTATREGIAHTRGPVGKDNPIIHQLAADLFLRRIREIHFAPGLTGEDLVAFLRVLMLGAKDLRAVGGAQRQLEAQGVQGIQIRDLEYHKEAFEAAPSPPPPAVEGAPLEIAEPADRTPLATEPPVQEPSLEIAEPEPSSPLTLLEQMLSQPPPPPETVEEEALADLETLLERLEAAGDERDYGRISVEIEAKGKAAVAAGDTATFTRIVPVYALHIQPTSPKSEAIKDRARDAIDVLGDPEAVAFLLDKLSERDVPQGDALILTLAHLGEAATPLLVSRLCAAEEGMLGRRRLIAALSDLGPAAVPHVAQALHEQPWPATRVLLSFLEQTGGPEAAAAVEVATMNADRRIRREAVRVLGRIGGPEGAGRLLEALGDGDAGVRLQAVIGLGVIRDPRAVAPLLDVAQRPADPELRRAAIGALGTIGDRAVVPALATLLSKRRWFRPKEPDEIRVVAAQALGALGGPEAIVALRAERRWGKGPVRDACVKALERATVQERA